MRNKIKLASLICLTFILALSFWNTVSAENILSKGNNMEQKTVLMTGATGMVGSQTLSLLLEDTRVGKVISIGRRKTGVTHPKLYEIVHKDFKDFSGLADELTGIDACLYCLGVYQSQVSKEEFYEITCDYQKALTDVLEKTSPNASFALFSAQGADTDEDSFMLFGKVKGKAENLVHKTPFPKKYIFRPGYIHPTGKKSAPGLLYAIVMPAVALLYKIVPSIGIDDRDIGKVMIEVALSGDKPSATFSNKEMRDLARS